MKDKEKQIEEMAKEIELAKKNIWENVYTRKEFEDYLWHSRRIAEHLTNKNYRKIDKDSIVQPTVQSYSTLDNDLVMLSREEYEELKLFEERVRSGVCFTQKEWFDFCNEDSKKRTSLIVEAKEKARIETVREILSKWAETDKETGGFNLPYIYELAKQYGVEIDK